MKQRFIILFISVLCLHKVSAQVSVDKKWDDLEIQDRINSDIEKYRKGWAEISFVDVNKQPLTNVEVVIEQQTHEFLFGCNLFVLGQLKTPELNSKYESAFVNLFNFATIPFYWRALEPQEGKPRFKEGSPYIWRRPPPDRLVKWCEAHNITTKGHALMYNKNRFMPDWTERHNPELFMKQVEKHLERIADRYKNDITVWDVVNEERYRTRNPDKGHKVHDDYLVECFRITGDLFPKNVELLYNDDTQNHDNPDEYVGYVESIIKAGLKIDGMGLQFHLFSLDARDKFTENSIYPPGQLLNVYDRIGKVGLPIYITEITIPGSGENGSVIQSEIVKNLYRLWFSTPDMAGITWWNLGDGTAYGDEDKTLAGLLDKNMNPKAAYYVLDELINNEWKTNITVQTGSSNSVKVKGFYGKYKLTIKYDGKIQEKEINLAKEGGNGFIIEL